MPAFDLAACVELAKELTLISMAAAAAIRRAQTEAGVRMKADGSPVTAADEAADSVIRNALSRLDPTLRVISEEQAEREKPKLERSSFVLVDPLDGTREFMAGRDEYTVNIALVCDGVPVLGIITAPALGLIWRGIVGGGAERMEFAAGKTSSPTAIHTRPCPQRDLLVMISRSHLDPQTDAYLHGFSVAQRIPCGSALKFCRLAEGAADLYPRLSPTRDWDVAAGHAILAAAGGEVTAPDGAALIYGSPDLRIPAFVACGDPSADSIRPA